jgi:hypothetical protein
VPTVHHVTHDFSEPKLGKFFNDPDEDLPQKEEILVLDEMVHFTIYWVENMTKPVNSILFNLTDIQFRGRILVFKRKANGMRFVNLYKHNMTKATEGIAS